LIKALLLFCSIRVSSRFIPLLFLLPTSLGSVDTHLFKPVWRQKIHSLSLSSQWVNRPHSLPLSPPSGSLAQIFPSCISARLLQLNSDPRLFVDHAAGLNLLPERPPPRYRTPRTSSPRESFLFVFLFHSLNASFPTYHDCWFSGIRSLVLLTSFSPPFCPKL